MRATIQHIRDMEPTLEQMARSLVDSGDYRVTSRLEPQAEYDPPDNTSKLVAAVVDVETTGTNPDTDKIVELGICLFEYDQKNYGTRDHAIRTIVPQPLEALAISHGEQRPHFGSPAEFPGPRRRVRRR